jgi:hypothetical protein
MKNKKVINIGWIVLLVIIILKILGFIKLGWFWVLTSFIWFPIFAFLSFFGIIFTITIFIRIIFNIISYFYKNKI